MDHLYLYDYSFRFAHRGPSRLDRDYCFQRIQSATALHIAVLVGSTDLVNYFPENRADPHQGSPIITAAVLGFADIVSLLLEHGVQAGGSHDYIFGALHAASMINDVKMVNMLIKRGANIREKDYEVPSCLFVAAWHRNHDVMQVLLHRIHRDRGDFLYHSEEYFRRAYESFEACDKGNAMEMTLEEEEEEEEKFSREEGYHKCEFCVAFGSNPVIWDYRDWDTAKRLLDRVVITDLTSKTSITTFFQIFCVACAVGSICHVKLLLECFPDPRILKESFEYDTEYPRSKEHASLSWTLTLAASRGHAEVVRLIFKKGQELRQDLTRGDALEYTCQAPNISERAALQVVEVLLWDGFDVHHRGNAVYSSVSGAINRDRWKLVARLLKAGVSVDVPGSGSEDEETKTARQLAHDLLPPRLDIRGWWSAEKLLGIHSVLDHQLRPYCVCHECRLVRRYGRRKRNSH